MEPSSSRSGFDVGGNADAAMNTSGPAANTQLEAKLLSGLMLKR